MRFHILLILLLGLLSSCSNRVTEYRADADTFCKLHSLEQWKSRKGYTALENMGYLASKIRTSIKTDKFLEIFDRLSRDGYEDFYSALQPEISKLIGEEWNCEDARKFYSIEWKRTDVNLDNYTINVTALNDTTLEIGKKKYKITDNQGISSAIKSESKGHDYKIILIVPIGTSNSKINEYLEPFRYMGLKSLSVKYH